MGILSSRGHQYRDSGPIPSISSSSLPVVEEKGHITSLESLVTIQTSPPSPYPHFPFHHAVVASAAGSNGVDNGVLADGSASSSVEGAFSVASSSTTTDDSTANASTTAMMMTTTTSSTPSPTVTIYPPVSTTFVLPTSAIIGIVAGGVSILIMIATCAAFILGRFDGSQKKRKIEKEEKDRQRRQTTGNNDGEMGMMEVGQGQQQYISDPAERYHHQEREQEQEQPRGRPRTRQHHQHLERLVVELPVRVQDLGLPSAAVASGEVDGKEVFIQQREDTTDEEYDDENKAEQRKNKKKSWWAAELAD